MDLPTQTHLTDLRNLLLSRERDLQAELDSTDDPMKAADRRQDCEVVDFLEQAEWRQQDQCEESRHRIERAELARVQAALARLDDGTYGDCMDCEEPIPFDRLRIQPAAQRCSRCQAEAEHGSLTPGR